MSVQPTSGKVRLALLALAGVLAISQPAAAETLYATSIYSTNLFSVDTTTHVVSTVFNAGVDLDSLFFDPNGRIIYSASSTMVLSRPTTLTRTLLSSWLQG